MAMMDPKQRYESAYRIQKLVYDEAIYLALYNAMETYGVSKKVKGFVGRADEFMDLWNVSLGD
jgi:ABC-type transport system substrate-binding protein